MFCFALAWSSIHICNGQQWFIALWSWSRWNAYWAGWLWVTLQESNARDIHSNPIWKRQIDCESNAIVLCWLYTWSLITDHCYLLFCVLKFPGNGTSVENFHFINEPDGQIFTFVLLIAAYLIVVHILSDLYFNS